MINKKLVYSITICLTLLSSCNALNTNQNNQSSNFQITTENNIYSASDLSKSNQINFNQINANFRADGIFLSPEKQETLKSCLILNADQLKKNLIQPSAAYSEEFFKDNALIFVNVEFGSGRTSHVKVTKVTYDKTNFTINVERGPQNVENEEIQWWCCFLEISKSDIKDATKNAKIDIIKCDN